MGFNMAAAEGQNRVEWKRCQINVFHQSSEPVQNYKEQLIMQRNHNFFRLVDKRSRRDLNMATPGMR
ncbi:unnamed protein product [Gongylonema pulchrum]|uniref:Ovule protein n=1 Tax=Gongylonema pulchrum TaxID=637853 RepID=A0A183E5S9_9BILA|nr:unnamed protein product [Gongylonema pulchrum]